MQLLQQRNDWFLKFLQLTQGYFAQLQANATSATEDIDYFLNNRQSLINIIDRTEKKITQFSKLNKIKVEDLAPWKAQIDALGKEKEKTAKELANLDTLILRILTRAKQDTEEQLKNVTRGKRAISGYRRDDSAATKVDVQR